jgi:hypothetical protein
MCYFGTILITFLLSVPAVSVELFRYRGAAKGGGTLEYVFEAGEHFRLYRKYDFKFEYRIVIPADSAPPDQNLGKSLSPLLRNSLASPDGRLDFAAKLRRV